MIKIEILSAREPRWADEQKTAILCRIKTNHFKHEEAFCARPDDTEAHGRDLYVRCLAGEFGPIKPFEPLVVSVNTPAPSLAPPPAWPELHEFLAEANLENARGTARGVILVWAAMLETMLGRLLEAFLTDHGESRKFIWEDGQSSFGTFSGRIKAAFSLGLIDKDEERNCHHIRRIRNFAAHEWKLSVDNPKFRKEALPALKGLFEHFDADYLVYHEDLDFLIRLSYSGACSFLLQDLAIRIVETISERRQARQ